MSNDTHEFIQKIVARSGGTVDPNNRHAIYEHVALESALYNPLERAAIIEALDKQLDEDESPLREQAQLLTLRRALTDSDRKLKLANR